MNRAGFIAAVVAIADSATVSGEKPPQPAPNARCIGCGHTRHHHLNGSGLCLVPSCRFCLTFRAAQDSAATIPQVAADQASVPDRIAALAAQAGEQSDDVEDCRSSGSSGPSRPRTAAHKPATKEQRQ